VRLVEWTENGATLVPVEDRDELILEHLPLVKYHAYRLVSQLPPSIEVSDLISAGVIGLMDAAAKFNPLRGVQFKTYADVRIRGAMIDSLRELDWAPPALRRKARKLREVTARLEHELGRAAGEQEICEKLDISIEELHQLNGRLHSLTIGSVRDSIEGDPDRTLDTYPDSISDGPHLQYLKQELKTVIAEAIDRLGPKERLVVSLYHFDELTMKEIAAVLDVNESRVSQIHTKAMAHLRQRLKSSGYESFSQ
jgi:RNA polymerase sigma factor FliA